MAPNPSNDKAPQHSPYATYAQGFRIPLDEQRETLESVLAAAAEPTRDGRPRIVVFDLDSTIFDNRPRQARILREFGVHASLIPLLRTRPEHFTNWSLSDAMRAAGLDEKSIALHSSEARRFWRDRFFTSPYCEDDIAIAGAADFLAAVLTTGATIAYVTGRHVDMGEGTIHSMRTCLFPIPSGPDDNRVQLLLKPTFEMNDDAWKTTAYARLDELGCVIAAFDNEPAHINGYAARYIQALCVRLATDDSGRNIPLAPSIVEIANFLR